MSKNKINLCTYCGEETKADWLACPSCGSHNHFGYSCPTCAEKIDEKQKKCDKCGRSLFVTCPHCGEKTFVYDVCEKCGEPLMVKCARPRCSVIQIFENKRCTICSWAI